MMVETKTYQVLGLFRDFERVEHSGDCLTYVWYAHSCPVSSWRMGFAWDLGGNSQIPHT